jgi:predicted signal transduction protein with EAL and GGDEF domain
MTWSVQADPANRRGTSIAKRSVVPILSVSVAPSRSFAALLPLARTRAARDIATFERARRVCRYARVLATRIGADGRGRRSEALTSLSCSVKLEDQLISALVIDYTAAGSFTDEHRRFLERVSEQAAAVVYNSKRFEQTKHESHTDSLTGMPNRRSLDRQLEAGLQQIRHSGVSGTVVVLELDRLKEINDTYGHDVGDRALRAAGNILRATVRDNDVCAIRPRRIHRGAETESI